MNKREERTLVHQRCVERIKRLRAMRGISQAQAAFQLGGKAHLIQTSRVTINN